MASHRAVMHRLDALWPADRACGDAIEAPADLAARHPAPAACIMSGDLEVQRLTAIVCERMALFEGR